MKFGSQILDKSVPEWKLSNIDYEELKSIIKHITKEGKEQYSLDDFAGLNDKFIENFNQVNLFINLKVKEISSKLVSIETSISRLFEEQAADSRLLKRRVRAIKAYLENCSTLLQKLSRFVIVQRIGLRKLFKKISKHYGDKAIAKEYILSVKTCKELVQGYEGISFQHLDLQPYLVEVSLVMDVLTDISVELKDGTLEGMEKTKFDRAKLLNRNSSNKTADDVKNSLKKNSQFDAFFLEKCEGLQRILIRSDNNEQLKFLLINLGYQVFDESLLKRSREIIHQEGVSDTRSLKSMKSFYDTERAPLKRVQTRSSEGIVQTDELEQGSSSISILSNYSKLSDNSFSNESENRFPNMVIEYYKQQVPTEECIMMCHVGGLRGSIITNSLSRTNIIKILQDDKSVEVSDPIGKLASEWVATHHLRACSPRINYKRTRYISKHKKYLHLITIDDQISFGTKAGNESPMFDHSFMEIRKFPMKKISSGDDKDPYLEAIMEELYRSKIECIPFRQSLTLWKLMSKLVIADSKIDALKGIILEDVYSVGEGDNLSDDEFFGIGSDILLELCSKQFQIEQSNISRDASKTPNGWKSRQDPTANSTTQSLKQSDRSGFRYWNEFDELEEENSQNSFFQEDNDGDLEMNGMASRNDFGFIHLSNDFIESTYNLAQRVRHFFGMNDGADTLLSPALQDLAAKYDQRNYGSISSDRSAATNSYDDIRKLIEHQKLDLRQSTALYEYKHDQVLSLIYIFALLNACVTSGVCMGIVLYVFTDQDSDVDIVVGKTLIVTIIASLTISLILVILCLLLLFSRYTYAPIWHYILSFTLFIMIMGTVCYGLIEIFL